MGKNLIKTTYAKLLEIMREIGHAFSMTGPEKSTGGQTEPEFGLYPLSELWSFHLPSADGQPGFVHTKYDPDGRFEFEYRGRTGDYGMTREEIIDILQAPSDQTQ